MRSAGAKASTAVADVSGLDGVRQAAQESRESLNSPVVGLVANAALVLPDSVLQPNPASFDKVMRVNVTGMLNTLQEWAPDLVQQAGKTSIVFVGSLEGLKGGEGLNAYVASKHAVTGIARTAAIELGPKGVRVNIVAPGTIATHMYVPEQLGDDELRVAAAMEAATPLRRVGRPEEIATVVHGCSATLRMTDRAAKRGAYEE